MCLSACRYTQYMCACCPHRPEEGIRYPGIKVTEIYKPLHGYKKLNPGPLKKHYEYALLTSKPSLQDVKVYNLIKESADNK